MKTVFVTMSAQYVSSQCSAAMILNSGMRTTIGENIWIRSSNSMNPCRPRKRSRATAYPAGIAAARFSAVAPTPMIRLFRR